MGKKLIPVGLYGADEGKALQKLSIIQPWPARVKLQVPRSSQSDTADFVPGSTTRKAINYDRCDKEVSLRILPNSKLMI